MTFTTVDRVAACLAGIATGDAIGKQTETLSRRDVQRWYPDGVRGFEGPPGSIIPRYAGNSKREWRVGETTDDTERTLAVAKAILTSGRVSHEDVGRELLKCTKCVHRGIASLWEFHQAGDPGRCATRHDGCGAAIRVAPVGILHGSGSLDDLVKDAREASISTHGGSLAIAAAAATAAAVSAAVDGASPAHVLHLAGRAAICSESTSAVFADAIRAVHDDLAGVSSLEADEVAKRWFPANPLTIVPLALALATLVPSAADAITLAANIGGDSDSVASIAGGIAGAMYPETLHEGWREVVERVNSHGLERIASELARMRHRAI